MRLFCMETEGNEISCMAESTTGNLYHVRKVGDKVFVKAHLSHKAVPAMDRRRIEGLLAAA